MGSERRRQYYGTSLQTVRSVAAAGKICVMVGTVRAASAHPGFNTQHPTPFESAWSQRLKLQYHITGFNVCSFNFNLRPYNINS